MNSGHPDPAELLQESLEPVRASLAHDGAAVVPNLVPEELCSDARAAIDGWLQQHGDDTALRSGRDRGLLPLNQHPAFWAIREHAPIYDLFRGLLGTPFLWVTVDAGVHDPAGSRGSSDTLFGWEMDPRRDERHLRGMLLLTDAEPGALTCVPHIFRRPDPWLSIYGLEPFPPTRIRDGEVLELGGSAGSLIIWDARLPTTRGPDALSRARYAMLLAMDSEGDDERRAERVKNFQEGLPPAWCRHLPGQPERGDWPAATLGTLGERLLGARPW